MLVSTLEISIGRWPGIDAAKGTNMCLSLNNWKQYENIGTQIYKP
jgi:hypothetical protein